MGTTRTESGVEQVNVHEAKTHLSRLLDRAASGEEIVIAKAGVPVARLVQFVPELRERVPGSAKGDVWMSDDFDAPLPDFEDAFE